MRKLWFCLCLFVLSFQYGVSQSLRVAVAANAQFILKALQTDFERETGIKTEVIPGSSGKLATQIKNGAPYDIFLSADTEYPEILFKEGFGIRPPDVYALGSLIVCSTSDLNLKNWQSLLTGKQVKKIAIANPALAPYGRAAEEALRHYGYWEKVRNKIVLGESIAQVNTYINSGVVSLGFTTEALLQENAPGAKLKWVRVDQNVYQPIRQAMLLLSYAKKNNYANAQRFYNYIQSPAAKALFKKYGYRIP